MYCVTTWKPHFFDVLFLTIRVLIASPNTILPPDSSKRILTRTSNKTITIIIILTPRSIRTQIPNTRYLRRISKPRHLKSRLSRLKWIGVRFHTSPATMELLGLGTLVHICLIPEMQVFVTTAVMRFSCRFQFGDEILSELGAALVDGHGVTDYLCCASCRVGEFRAFHEGIFEAWDTIDCVEETEKSDAGNRLDLFLESECAIALTDGRGEKRSPGKQTCSSGETSFDLSPCP